MACFIECVTAEPIVAVLNNFDKSMQFTNMLGEQLILPFLDVLQKEKYHHYSL